MPRRAWPDHPTIIKYRAFAGGSRRTGRGIGQVLARQGARRMGTGEYELVGPPADAIDGILAPIKRLLEKQGPNVTVSIEILIGRRV